LTARDEMKAAIGQGSGLEITIYDVALFVTALFVGFGIGYFWKARWLWFTLGFFFGAYAVAKLYNLNSDRVLGRLYKNKETPLDGLDQAEEK